MFKVFETEFCGRKLIVETGKMAQLAGGSFAQPRIMLVRRLPAASG